MSQVTRQHWMLDDDATPGDLEVETEMAGDWCSVTLRHGEHPPACEFAISGPIEVVAAAFNAARADLERQLREIGRAQRMRVI